MDFRILCLVISTRPKGVISISFAVIWSFASSSLKTPSSCFLCSSSFISIKSTMMIPDRFLSLNCAAISAAASQFTLKKVSGIRFSCYGFSRINIYRHKCFRRLYHQICSRIQPHLILKGIFKLSLQSVEHG